MADEKKTEPTDKPVELSDDQAGQVAGGAQDFLLDLGDVKGESKATPVPGRKGRP